MRIRLKGINSQRKRLADGSFKTYYWAWKGGPPLRVSRARRNLSRATTKRSPKVAPPTGVLLALLFRFQESAEFQFGISPRTRRDYIKQIKRIERELRRFSDQGAGRSAATVDLSRMARSAGANIVAASRLCLWHPGADSFLGA